MVQHDLIIGANSSGNGQDLYELGHGSVLYGFHCVGNCIERASSDGGVWLDIIRGRHGREDGFRR